MTFRTITTFEKASTDVQTLAHSVPGMDIVGSCFAFEGNPYLEKLEIKNSTDRTYAEYHIYFHDEANYLAWHDQFKAQHDNNRELAFKVLKFGGVDIKRYWEDANDRAEAGALPISQFVSKL